MKFIPRTLILAVLAWFAWVLLQNVHTLQTVDENGIGIPDAQMKVILYFGGIVLVATFIGVNIALTLIPILGEKIAAFLFNMPNTPVEKDPHAEAKEYLVNEKYAEAIKAYFKAYHKNPKDAEAIGEIAQIYCERFHDSAAAIATLEEALKGKWSKKEAVYLRARLKKMTNDQ